MTLIEENGKNRQIAEIEQIPVINLENEVLSFKSLHGLENLHELKKDFNALIHCHSGSLKLMIADTNEFEIHEGEMLLIPFFKSARLLTKEKEADGTLLLISDDALKAVLGNQIYIWNSAMYLNEVNIVEVKDWLGVIKQLGTIILGEHDALFYELTFSLLRTIMLLICKKLLSKDMQLVNNVNSSPREKYVFYKFIRMISEQDIKYKEVSFYAKQLNTTAKYLSTICMNVSGKKPLEWINEGVMRDCYSLLANTDLSVKEIAFRMGFANPSFFGQYFKQHTGTTPLTFRERLKKITNKNN